LRESLEYEFNQKLHAITIFEIEEQKLVSPFELGIYEIIAVLETAHGLELVKNGIR